jgi:ABC-type amino acid transport substrate-binding protein
MTRFSRRAFQILSALLFVAIASASLSCGALADTLDRLRQQKVMRIAYREDAPPFSFKNNIGEPAGYMVDLCRAVAGKLAQEQQIAALTVEYVPVTAANRFDAIQQGKADLLCEPTSVTLSRRKLVDFSIATYVDGASLMIRSDGPRDLQSLSGSKVGVLRGTTTEQELRSTIKEAGLSVEVVLADTHAQGLAMLESGAISAYFGDRGILLSLVATSTAPDKLAVAENLLSIELYALALPYGDEKFRLAIDQALSHIYRSGEIAPIFARNFPSQAKPTAILAHLYLISGLPD